MPKKKWSGETVIATIQKLHKRGVRLNSLFVQEHNRKLYLAANFYFKGWRQAIEAAGIGYDSVRVLQPKRKVVWSKEIIIKTLQTMHTEGLPLNSNYIQTHNQRLYGATVKYFGGWAEAIEASGLDYKTLRKKELRTWTKQKIVDEILTRFEAGLSIAGATVGGEDRGLYQAAHRHFGENGWAKARILAGFNPIDPLSFKIWNEETIAAEIRRLHEAGVPLNTGALQNSEYAYILASGNNVFGSWAKAVRAAGLNYSSIRKTRQAGWWTRPRILMTIKSLEKRGVRLSLKNIQSSGHGLCAAAIKRFGSWSEAVEAAGISYQTHCQVWSTKAWLRRMKPQEYNDVIENARTLAHQRRQ